MGKGTYKRGRIWWITYQGLDGKQKFESSTSSLKADAQYLLACRRKEIAEGKEPLIRKIPNYTFKELSDEYIKWAERQRGFRQKANFIKQLLNVVGLIQLKFFNAKILEQYQTGRIQKGNKPATANRHIATLKHMFTKAVEWDMVDEETLRRVRRVKLLEENNSRLRYLTKEECIQLINSCDSHLKPVMITALNTGCRKSEILNLKWDEHIDLTHGFILLNKTKSGDRREIPINKTLRVTLQSITRRLDMPYVFYNPDTAKPYKDLKKSFKTACRRAKIKDFLFHDSRHTFASHLVMAGVDLITVKELMGHKSLSMTLRYAHLAPGHKVKAVDTLDNAINEKVILNRINYLGVSV